MARPRTPIQKAKVTGVAYKKRLKFESRKDASVSEPLGKPPAWMSEHQIAAWALFVKEVPWLNSSHRGLVEIAATIRGRLMSGEEVGVQALNLLRQALGQMGATPADASKATVRPDDGEEDAAENYFN
jgi:hypothetical protein